MFTDILENCAGQRRVSRSILLGLTGITLECGFGLTGCRYDVERKINLSYKILHMPGPLVISWLVLIELSLTAICYKDHHAWDDLRLVLQRNWRIRVLSLQLVAQETHRRRKRSNLRSASRLACQDQFRIESLIVWMPEVLQDMVEVVDHIKDMMKAWSTTWLSRGMSAQLLLLSYSNPPTTSHWYREDHEYNLG